MVKSTKKTAKFKGALPLALAALVTLSAGRVAWANDAADLTKLEEHFFHTTYDKDTSEARLNRLEKMVFGEAKSGADQQRLSTLLQAIPTDESAPASESAPESPATGSEPASQDGSKDIAPRSFAKAPPASAAPHENVSGTKYPAVTAIEQKVLGKDYASENVEQRLTRLETKLFGKPSTSDDLSDRVDRLKQKSGIDIAARPPSGSDWDEEDDLNMPANTSPPMARGGGSADSYSADLGEDGKSFSGRDLRKDFQQAFGRGAYGMGGSSGTVTSGDMAGAYGFGGGSTPTRRAPSYLPSPGADGTGTGMGLNQQVTALETEILSKTYPKDPLPARLTRLETTVFPQDKPSVDKSLPERVQHLLAVVPISAPSRSTRLAQRPKGDPDFPELDQDGMPPTAPQRSGLSKIINSLGNMLGGGAYGGYPMRGGLVTDPSTGLLLDPTTGNLIDPNTGTVVGRRVVQQGYGAPGMGMGMGMSPYGGFNNGFSNFGMGGGPGLNFGMGGMGVGRGFGMWP